MTALAFLESPAPPRLPVTIVTGFLGSGKTTLVNHILANQQGLRTAVIVNDLSDVDGEAARDQLIYGHVILLNKCDLVGTERLCALEEAIGNVAARARITRTTRCNVPLAPILRLGCFNRNGFSPITRPMLPHSPTLA
jgi:G3E family GTPase